MSLRGVLNTEYLARKGRILSALALLGTTQVHLAGAQYIAYP